MKLTSHIILEGSDGAGKSTLFRRLETNGFPMGHHGGGPPTSEEDASRRLSDIRASSEMLVWDRCFAISDQVYRYALREPFNLPPHRLMAWLTSIRPVIIYCRPDSSVIMSQHIEPKVHKPQKHIDKILMNRNVVIQEYDSLMEYLKTQMGLHVIRYDFASDSDAVALTYMLRGSVVCAA